MGVVDTVTSAKAREQLRREHLMKVATYFPGKITKGKAWDLILALT